MTSTAMSPNSREILSARSTITAKQEYLSSTNNILNVNVTGGGGGGDVNLTEVGGVAISLGQKTMANSLPITIASDQSALAVSQSGTWNIGTVATITNPVTVTGSVSVSGTIAVTQSTSPWIIAGGGTAGTAASGVVTIQGIASMTAVKVDGTGGTFPVSGTVTANQGTSPWVVNTGSAIGATIPANAFYTGISDGTNLVGMRASSVGDGISSGVLANAPYLFNGTNNDRTRSIINATDTTGTGVVAAGMLGQFDDTSPGTVTENRFGNIRMSGRREMYQQIRDAAGNERGANVNASNQLSTSVDNNPVLGAGTNAIGKLAANSGVDIGDVTLNNDQNAGTTSSNTIRIVIATGATGTLSNVAASATSVTVLAANTSRVGATITNDSTSDVYLKYGSSASTTSYTYLLPAGAWWSYEGEYYNGIITGIWNTATGNARVTEVTA